ncbi:putative septum formation protein maf protein [Eutypa lata UCREL1]|uniref:Putative septum formation protein maf protein n=1 Tax=Eutypa lata (strain UCR-EL1) TaxID=1287681 RepID=M7SW56_EUTLA|nr:putative septum formation protein maf protein [Eutypa lata UCREL1]
MDEKQPLMSDDKTSTMPSDRPPSYITAAREHGIRLRQSAPIRKGGAAPLPAPLPAGPPQPLELPIVQYMKTHRVILASASPRRRAMFAQLGLSNIEVRASTKPEDLSKTELGPFGYVAGTARQKALDVYQTTIAELVEAVESKTQAEEEEDDDEDDTTGDSTEDAAAAGKKTTTGNKKNSNNNNNNNNNNRKSQIKQPHPGGDPDLVIAADTVIVTRDGQILEKPASAAAHARMLRHLRDTRAHKVLTAVCAVAPRADAQHPGYEMRTHVEETRVLFARESDGLPDDVIDSYVRSREGADKAGGYAIQGVGGMLLVEKVEGSVDNVVGLPMRKCLALCEKVVFKQGVGEEDSEAESDEGEGDW